MKKSQVLTFALICLTFAFGNTINAQTSAPDANDESWVTYSKEKLNDLTEELKEITSDESLSEEEKSDKLQETNEELLSIISELDEKSNDTKRYKFVAKTPINSTPIVTELSKTDENIKPSNAERDSAMSRLNKAEENLHKQKLDGKISDSDYSAKLDRIKRAKMQITSI